MTTVLIVIHLMVVLALIGVVLLQRSEGGALGIGGGSGAFMSGRGAGNVLTRSTAILAAAFFATSITLTLIARFEGRPGDILDRLPAGATTTPAAPASGESQPAAGVPATAQDLLNSLGGSGPQTPPASGGESAPAGSSLPQSSAPQSTAPQPSAGSGAEPATDTTQTGSPPDSNTAPQEPALTGGASTSDTPQRSEPIPAPAPDVPADASTAPAAGGATDVAPQPAPATSAPATPTVPATP